MNIRAHALSLSSTNLVGCHWVLSLNKCVSSLFLLISLQILLLQISRGAESPQSIPPEEPAATSVAPVLTPDMPSKVPRPNAPPPGEQLIRSVTQTKEGPITHLRGAVEIELTDMMLKADEVDYNEETGDAEARGHVFFEHYVRNERLMCVKADYNFDTETGKFYEVRGYVKTRIDARPGILTSANPFYFEGRFAERVSEKYILHDGFITGCKMPRPWWTLRAPTFDIVPDERALAYRAVFRLRRVPLFFTPFFYKSLEKAPRKSGFLTPNIGNSSRRGKMIGVGYYWAINRSFDVTYRVQDFTERGFAHHVDFRGKPTAGSDFDAIFYGVQDKGLLLNDGTRRKEGGFNLYMTGRADLGHGWVARGNVNYLSSLKFRQAFTESFNEAIFSESHSIGYVSKHFSTFTINAIFARLENFQNAAVDNSIVIRKLPEIEFSSRDREIVGGPLPLWFSLESSAGLLRRTQPLFQTRQFFERVNFEPRVMTSLRWGNFHLIPSFTLHEAHYGGDFESGRVTGRDYNRNARELGVELVVPSVERIFNRKTWLGDKLKHVIEPRASFRYVAGITDFERLIRFDATELLSNTTELEVSLANRLYAKRGDNVSEVLSWQVFQYRYFDPTFGGAAVAGQRNVLLSSADLTAYTFLDGPRSYSPIASVLRTSPHNGIGLEWRADYDPLRGAIVDSGFTADVRVAKYFLSAGHNQVRSDPLLSPNANQLRGVIGFGDLNRRGWNAGFTAIYDYRQSILQFATTQVTYNTDCCGFNVQFRRFSFGTRNENQFRIAFAIANVGSFGTLKKQERLF